MKKRKQFNFVFIQGLTLRFAHFILVVASQPEFLNLLNFLSFSIKSGQWSRHSNPMALLGTRSAGSFLFLA